MRKTTPGASLRRPKQLLVSYAMLLPFLFFFFLMFVMPIFVSLFMSFTNFNMLQTPDFVGFSNYIKLFLDDDVFVTALTNTMVFAFISGPISYVLCFLLAWIISDLGPTLRSIVTVCFYAPSVAGTGIYVVWRLIFSSDSYGMIKRPFDAHGAYRRADFMADRSADESGHRDSGAYLAVPGGRVPGVYRGAAEHRSLPVRGGGHRRHPATGGWSCGTSPCPTCCPC